MTVCRNRLWYEENRLLKPKKTPPKRSYDPVCEYCENKPTCVAPCAPIKWINGNVARKEPLVSEICDDTFDSSDNYNAILAELIESRQNALETISQIRNIKKKAIAAMLIVGISRNEVSDLIDIEIINKTIGHKVLS